MMTKEIASVWAAADGGAPINRANNADELSLVLTRLLGGRRSIGARSHRL
jgi:hypothetical protein